MTIEKISDTEFKLHEKAFEDFIFSASFDRYPTKEERDNFRDDLRQIQGLPPLWRPKLRNHVK